jgi:hypothetical protein
MVDMHDDATQPQERWRAWCKLEMISATGFLMDFGRPRPTADIIQRSV